MTVTRQLITNNNNNMGNIIPQDVRIDHLAEPYYMTPGIIQPQTVPVTYVFKNIKKHESNDNPIDYSANARAKCQAMKRYQNKISLSESDLKSQYKGKPFIQSSS